MPEDRRLAAIMFTDIVGYTALMGKDEDQAFKLLRKNREIQQPLIEQYNGTLLKEIGDGILASFSTASDAVRSSIEIQKVCKEGNILLRIGIHEGEVVFAGRDVLGDGVNVASRLQEAAEEGCISISGAVYKDVKNKAGINTNFIEEKSFKNVDEPIKIYKVCCEDVEEIKKQEESPGQPATPSIAVLPFVNMSNDPEQEYFCDGMSEEIINALSHVESLKVIARTSAFMFKGKQEDMREIGKKLDVETLLEGSVRKAGNRLRITAQLIKVSDGSHLWSERYDRDLEDVFTIQDEISLAIVDNLKVRLLGEEKAAIVKRHTENLEAYNLLLTGRHFYNKGSEGGMKKAIEYFEKVIEKVPDSAQAYAGLAGCHIWLGFYDFLSQKIAFPKAKKEALRAIEIDQMLSEAHASLGWIKMTYDWDWEDAEKEYKKAIELNPNHAPTYSLYALYFMALGRLDETIEKCERSVELDPLSVSNKHPLGIALLRAGRLEQAREQFQKILELESNNSLARWWLGHTYILDSRYEEGILEIEKALDLSKNNTLILAGLGWAYAVSSRKNEAMKVAIELKRRTKKEYIRSYLFAKIHAALGETDQAFESLDKAYEEHDVSLAYMLSDETLVMLHEDKRFSKLLKKIGLEKYKRK